MKNLKIKTLNWRANSIKNNLIKKIQVKKTKAVKRIAIFSIFMTIGGGAFIEQNTTSKALFNPFDCLMNEVFGAEMIKMIPSNFADDLVDFEKKRVCGDKVATAEVNFNADGTIKSIDFFDDSKKFIATPIFVTITEGTKESHIIKVRFSYWVDSKSSNSTILSNGAILKRSSKSNIFNSCTLTKTDPSGANASNSSSSTGT